MANKFRVQDGIVFPDGTELTSGSSNSIENGLSEVIIPTTDGTVIINVHDEKEWQFLQNGSILFPDGSLQTTAYITSAQLGYFNELSHTGDNNRVNGEAVAMDSDGNSYVSYSYYNDNDSKNYGGVAKFSVTGEKLWSVDISSQNTDARYLEICSLEYTILNSVPVLVAFGSYYDTNTSKDVAVMFYINPSDGAVGTQLFDAEITSDQGMELQDGVFGTDNSSDPFAVVVGDTYDQKLAKTLTPLTGSTTDKLYFSWADVNAANVPNGAELVLQDMSYRGFYMNSSEVGALPPGSSDPSWAGLSLIISSTQGGSYVITRSNGNGYAVSGWSVPVSLIILGSALGGVDGINDMTFDFDKSVFNNNSNNIHAAVSNIQGTPVSNVYCKGFNGKDWSTEIGTPTTFDYNLNNQAFIARFGNDTWNKNLGESSYDRINSVVVDSSGNTFVAGYIWNGSRGSLVVKYNISGVKQWAVYIDPSNDTGNELTSIDLLTSGDVITVDEAGTITKLDKDDGNIIWQVTIDDNISWDANFRGTATPDDDYIITNYEDDDYTMYVMRVSGADGSNVWTKRITRTLSGDNGEIYTEDDFDAQYIDCNDTYFTIGATTEPNNGDRTGLVFSLPINGENVDGTYGEYVVSSETMSWTTQSTTSITATVTETPTNVTVNSVSPTKTNATITVNQTSVGSAPAVITSSIINGTSYANVTSSDGNVVIGVNNDNMTWNFATDGVIYGKSENNITITAIDPSNAGNEVRQTVVDGSNNVLTKTTLDSDTFSIETDVQGSDYRWQFSSQTLQTPDNALLRGYNSDIVIQSMSAGASSKARLQSVSNANDPNVFTTIDATTTGANIKVYDGGSVSGTEYTWIFDNTGNLILPGNTFSVNYANGTQVSLGGGGGSGISLSDISVGEPNSPSGSGDLSYDSVTGVFTYTPPVIPDVSGFVTGTPWNDAGFVTGTPWNDAGFVTGTPWTDAGYVTGTPWNDAGFVTGTPWTSEGYISAVGDDTNPSLGGSLSIGENSIFSSYGSFKSTATDGTVITGETSGASGSEVGHNVTIKTGIVETSDYNIWAFDADGNLTLPKGGVIREASIPTGGFDGNTISLKPSGGTNANQQLLIYPTGVGSDYNHLHLTSGNLWNTELFLGNDNFYVKLANTGNVIINSNDDVGNTAQWRFNTDGSIYATDELTIKVSNRIPTSIAKIGGNQGWTAGSVGTNLATTGGTGTGLTVDVSNGGGGYADISIHTAGTGYTDGDIVTVSNGGMSDSFIITTGFNYWAFDDTGDLTLPAGGDIKDSTGTSVLGGGSSLAEPSFIAKTANFNADSGHRYGVNTSDGAVTATLPASPATGDAIYFIDFGGMYSTNNLTIARNGHTIMGQNSDMTVSTNNESFGLAWNGTTWRVY